MDVQITTYGQARDTIGEKTIEREVPDGATVSEIFTTLTEEYPELEGGLVDDDGEIPPALNVTVNGTSVEVEDGLDTALEDGDELRVAMSLRGGG